MKQITRFFTKSYASIKKDFFIDTSYRLSFLMRWVGVILSVLTYYYLSKLIGAAPGGHLRLYGGDYFSFVLVGLAVISYLNSNVNGYVGTVLGEQRWGIMEFFLTTPTGVPMMLYLFALYNVLMGLWAGALFLILGGILGVDFSNANIWSAFVILVLSSVTFLSLGTAAAGFIIVFKRGDPLIKEIKVIF